MTSYKQLRDARIYQEFINRLGKGKLMDLYAQLGIEFYLSENRIRSIIRQEHRRATGN